MSESIPDGIKNLGWGFARLEVMAELPARRILLLDSDIVFARRVIDRLGSFDEDFILNKDDFDAIAIDEQLFPLDRLRQLNPKFEFPGYGFNSGQIIATTGYIAKQVFDGLLDWQMQIVTHPEVSKNGEQGLANYMVLRKVQQSKLTIRREPFMVWPGETVHAEHIRVKDFTPEGRHRQLIHWAGPSKGKTLEEMPGSEILLYFEKIYYRRVPLGAWFRQWRRARFRIHRTFITPLKIVAKRVCLS